MQIQPPELIYRIKAIQIRTVFNSFLIHIAGGPVALLLIGALLWDEIPHEKIGLWFALATSAIINLYCSMLLFQRQQTSDINTCRRGSALLTWSGLFTATTWGMSSFLFFPLQQPYEANFVMAMAMVIMASAGAGSGYLPSMLVFVIWFTLVFVSGILINAQHSPFFLAASFLLFSATTIFYCFVQNKQISKSIMLAFENEALLNSLRTQKLAADHAREEAIQARQMAEQANFAKTRFLASASHDLRQPMHALGLYVHHLKHAVNPAFSNIVEKIQSATQAMEELFNQILTIAKLEVGAEKVDVQMFPLAPLLERIAQQFISVAAHKGIVLKIVPTSVQVFSDPIQLERMLRNLVTNAIRYTESGKILVGCRYVSNIARIEVRDTGIGIPNDKQAEIFKEYYQVDDRERDRRKGLGLGLAIVKQLADLLKHELGVQSAVGKGSCFYINVPCLRTKLISSPAETNDEDIVSPEMLGKHILVIDDDPIVLDSMEMTLTKVGCRVFIARTKTEAMVLIKENEKPDLILSDYRLHNGETGVEVIKKIRKHFDCDIPAILISGDTAPEELKHVLSEKLEMLHKPVNPKALINAMRTKFVSAPQQTAREITIPNRVSVDRLADI